MRTTRRTLLAGLGATALGSIALNYSTDTASASVSMDNLNVPDTKEVTTESIEDVILSVNGSYSYEGNVTPDQWECTLKAGNQPDTTHPLATVSSGDLDSSGGGEFDLRGSLLDSPHFDMSNFALANQGDSKTTPFVAEVEFKVIRDNDVVAEARAVDSATITVTKEAVEVSASVEGSGGITVETG